MASFLIARFATQAALERSYAIDGDGQPVLAKAMLIPGSAAAGCPCSAAADPGLAGAAMRVERYARQDVEPTRVRAGFEQ